MARIIKHFEIVEDGVVDRVEVDYFDGDTYVYLEVKTYINDEAEEENQALVTISPKKAEKIGRALIKAAAEARKTKRERG